MWKIHKQSVKLNFFQELYYSYGCLTQGYYLFIKIDLANRFFFKGCKWVIHGNPCTSWNLFLTFFLFHHINYFIPCFSFICLYIYKMLFNFYFFYNYELLINLYNYNESLATWAPLLMWLFFQSHLSHGYVIMVSDSDENCV